MELLLAIVALLGNCGWFVSGRKYSQEVRRIRTETQQREFDLGKQYVVEFKQNIYEPLHQELQLLRKAIEAVNSCDYRDNCPVTDRMHDSSLSNQS